MIVADAEGLFDLGFGDTAVVRGKAAAPTAEGAASAAAEGVAAVAPIGIFGKAKALVTANPLYLAGGLVAAYYVWTKVLKKKVPFIGRLRRR